SSGSYEETGSAHRDSRVYRSRAGRAQPLEIGTVGGVAAAAPRTGGGSAVRSLHFGTIPAWNQVHAMASGQGSCSMPHGSSRGSDQVAAGAATQVSLMPVRSPRVFLLSPARIGGPRSTILMREEAEFELAIRLRQGAATVAEIYAFISGLYFRGKMAYAQMFGAAPEGVLPAAVIVPGMGLVPPDSVLRYDQLQAIASVPVEAGNEAYAGPLLRDAARL